jgi:hypothetical protein
MYKDQKVWFLINSEKWLRFDHHLVDEIPFEEVLKFKGAGKSKD